MRRYNSAIASDRDAREGIPMVLVHVLRRQRKWRCTIFFVLTEREIIDRVSAEKKALRIAGLSKRKLGRRWG